MWFSPPRWVQGTQGSQGTQGLQGIQGLQGSQGTQGTQGTQGRQGTQGTQGNQGLQGLSNQGVQGTQGIQGLQGDQGVQGLQGLSNQGVQGLRGSFGETLWEKTDVGINTLSNVGIGTTNPQTKLEIGGVLGFGPDNNVRIGDNTTGANCLVSNHCPLIINFVPLQPSITTICHV